MVKSKYVFFPEPGQVAVGEEMMPPPKENEVLCAAAKSLISSGTETICLRGSFDAGSNWGDWVKFPFRPGYCMVGRVIEAGGQARGLELGDRVMGRVPHQQYFNIDPREAYRIPAEVSDETAAWARLAVTAQLGVRRANLQIGESVGVIGLGILGQFVVQYCWLAGARRVVAIDSAEPRLKIAHDHGATHILALNAGDARAPIADLTRGRMLDVVFDVTGHPAVLSAAVQLVRRLGRVILLGDAPHPNQQFIGPGALSNSISIFGIHGSGHPVQSTDFSPWSRDEMTELFFDYVEQGRLNLEALTSGHVSPLKAPEVYRSLVEDRSKIIGLIFDWSEAGAAS